KCAAPAPCRSGSALNCRDLLCGVGVVAQPHDVAAVVERPEVDLLVAVATPAPGGQVDLYDELDRDLVAAFHHVEDLEVDDVHLARRLEEVDDIVLAVAGRHPGPP